MERNRHRHRHGRAGGTTIGAGRQRGAALIIGLVLLTVLFILGLTSVSTSILDQKMMINARESLNAFEAVESALNAALTSNTALAVDADTLPEEEVRAPVRFDLRESGEVSATATTRFTGFSDAVPVGWEQGQGMTVHFRIDSETTTTLRAADNSQSAGFYIVAPAP